MGVLISASSVLSRMSLDVPVPDPPTISRTSDGEADDEVTKRTDIEEYFDGMENAWEEGFDEWASATALTEIEYHTIREAGLLEAFDFRWDERAGYVTYEATRVPADWKQRAEFSTLDSWSAVSVINDELDELGETVAGVLTDYYIEWETEAHVVETFGSQFNARDDVLTDVEDASEEE